MPGGLLPTMITWSRCAGPTPTPQWAQA